MTSVAPPGVVTALRGVLTLGAELQEAGPFPAAVSVDFAFIFQMLEAIADLVSFDYSAPACSGRVTRDLLHGIVHADGQAVVDPAKLLQLGVPPAQHGIVDIVATKLVVELAEGDHVEVLVPPRLILGKRAGHIFHAVTSTACHDRSMEKLKTLVDVLILVVDNADSATANRKSMMYFGKNCGPNTLYFPNR